MNTKISIFILCLTLVGCVVTVDSDYSSGADWSERDVKQIEIGETKKDWIIAAIGMPNDQRIRSDGVEVWRYKNISERDTEVGIFLLLHMDLERERHSYLNIEFRDDVVIDYELDTKWVE